MYSLSPFSTISFCLLYRFLYEILTNVTVNRRQVPILVACNKHDIVTASDANYVRNVLLKEMYRETWLCVRVCERVCVRVCVQGSLFVLLRDTLRKTRLAMPSMGEDDGSGAGASYPTDSCILPSSLLLSLSSDSVTQALLSLWVWKRSLLSGSNLTTRSPLQSARQRKGRYRK